jgi:exodeoxyribonuclease V alpha subunit
MTASELYSERFGVLPWKHQTPLPFDARFAAHHSSKRPVQLFLRHLMAAARAGHLCVLVEEGQIHPDPLDLWLEDEALLPEILAGADEVEDPVVRIGNRFYLQQGWEWEELVWQQLQRLQGQIEIITGGPGTGKTTLAAKMIREAPADLRIAVAAPTGKAASRLGSLLGDRAQVGTLHALLPKAFYHPADLIVVDEASMIDASMMGRLLSAIKPKGRLVLMGDPDQLPPVESGALFAEMIDIVGARRLTRSHRMEEGLLQLADQVRRGILPELTYATDPLQSAIDGFQLLCPTREGVRRYNEVLRRHFCRRGKPVTLPIIICRNDYENGLFNGEVGQIHCRDGGRVAADDEAVFGDRSLPVWMLPSYELAYCLSVHKSQGSEFEKVLLLVPEGSERFGREVLYTAMTRAKSSLEVFGKRADLEEMVARQSVRLSGLKSRVSDCV